MAKRGKRGKRKLARLRKKLGFVPKIFSIARARFGSVQERVEAHGKAITLDKSRREIEVHEDRQQKQRGWSEE